MNIEILTYLRDNPINYPDNPVEKQFPIKGISISEIEAWETKFNNGNLFPKALRELLFIAGKDCYVLDYVDDTLEELRDHTDEDMTDYGMPLLTRPYFVIDAYNYAENHLIVYLDENKDDPDVYSLHLDNGIIDNIDITLKELINQGINRVKEGRNPF